MGLFGNVLVISAIILSRLLRNTANIFVFNLAIADLLVTGFVNFLAIISFIYPEYILEHFRFCKTIAVICYVACAASLFTLGVISVNRLTAIIYPQIYNSIFTRKNCFVLAASTWIICFLANIPNSVFENGYYLDHRFLMCVWNWNAVWIHKILQAGILVAFNGVLIVYCYFRIFWHVYKSKQKVSGNESKGNNQGGRKAKAAFSLMKTLFIITLCFLITWTPMLVMIIFDNYNSWSIHFAKSAVAMGHVNSSLNPIIYGATNKNYREAYKKVLCMKSPVSGENSNSASWKTQTKLSKLNDSVLK